MAQKILSVLAPFVIGLLLIELGLFCYSLYDPTLGALDAFPLRVWSYFLLLFGVMALVTGTLYYLTVGTQGEQNLASKTS